MALTIPPLCAESCVLSAAYSSTCAGISDIVCLCNNKTYEAAARACQKSLCSASDSQLWLQYGIERCAAVGIFFTSTAASSTPTPLTITSVVVVATTLTNPNGVAYSTITTTPSSPSNPASPITSNNPTPVSSSQSSDGGLSTGAKVGIAIGAVGIVLIGVLIALLLWRRNRKLPRDIPPETGTNIHGGDATEEPYGEKEVMAPTSADILPFKEPIISVFIPTELSAEQARFAEKHEQPVKVPELAEDPARVTSLWSSSDAGYPHELSPSTAYTELTAIVPSEVGGSDSPSSYVPYYHNGPAGAGSRDISYNASPYTPDINSQSLPAQELSSSTSIRPAIPYDPSPPASSVGPARVGQTDDREDAELNRMKVEIEALRVEKERIQHLQAIEIREQELSRKIVQRELSKGTGEPS